MRTFTGSRQRIMGKFNAPNLKCKPVMSGADSELKVQVDQASFRPVLGATLPKRLWPRRHA